MLRALLETMRPHQWVKNLLVLAPLGFAHGQIVLADVWPQSAQAFVVFCMLSSAIYLLNDIVDRGVDAQHPEKCRRPLPSGRLSVGTAASACAALGGGGLLWSGTLGAGDHWMPFVAWPLAYLALNLGYSFYLKHIVIVDCLSIALGFVLRVHAGAVVIGVSSSGWLLNCTFFFALFLAFCKRREEVERTDRSGATRTTMREYDLPFLDQVIAPLAALSILCYALYTFDPATEAKHGPYLTFTVPFVVFGVFRYLFLVHVRGQGADPAKLLFRDRQLVVSGVLWAGAVWLAITLKSVVS